MQLVLYSAIALAAVTGIASLSLILMWKQIQSLTNQVKSLTNLAASKDLVAFQSLQNSTSTLQSQLDVEPVNPLNDEAVAHALAERYKQQGIDPNYAYAQDEVNFAEEFGL